MLDMIFEYAARYGMPRASDPWALFMAGVARCSRFTARDLYNAMTGPSFALAGLSEEGAGQRHLVREELARTAFGLRAIPSPGMIGPRDG